MKPAMLSLLFLLLIAATGAARADESAPAGEAIHYESHTLPLIDG